MALPLHPYPERGSLPTAPLQYESAPGPQNLQEVSAAWATEALMRPQCNSPLGYCLALSELVSLLPSQVSSDNLFEQIVFPGLCGSQSFDNHLVERPSTPLPQELA